MRQKTDFRDIVVIRLDKLVTRNKVIVKDSDQIDTKNSNRVNITKKRDLKTKLLLESRAS